MCEKRAIVHNSLTGTSAFFLRLGELEKFAERVNSSLDKSGEQPSQYLHHPVNIFQLLNRYYNGWVKLRNSISHMNSGKGWSCMHVLNGYNPIYMYMYVLLIFRTNS